jgi:hypothetical protein
MYDARERTVQVITTIDPRLKQDQTNGLTLA